ncbi:MAG: malto-oligosyltrehalose trehalohydrolase, partial [Rhabdochlamydiaceae bacterium]
PWGPAINYDEAGCDEVRKYVVQNALYWIDEYHLDGLRLDAIHGIFDFSPKHILLEIAESVHSRSELLDREIHIISESDLNDPRLVSPRENGGLESDAQWSDDFHHSIHSYLTGERFGYYSDFGSLQDIKKSLESAFVYDGKYSEYRKRSHGAPCSEIPGDRFVSSMQNHDQVGNRPDGLRLSRLLPSSQLKIAAALLILSQSIPLLFMGEEYAETSPFYYFIDHSDRKVVRAVREGRKREFESLQVKPEYIDPQAISTFSRSKLNHSLRKKRENKQMLDYYRELILLRKQLTAFQNYSRDSITIKALEEQNTIVMERAGLADSALVVFVLGSKSVSISNIVKTREWNKIHDSTTLEHRLEQEYDSKPILNPKNNTSIFPPLSVTIYSTQKEKKA